MAARRRGGLMTSAVSSADGVTVRYDMHGRGLPALVLVHGWSCDRGYWRHLVPHFAAERTVVAVDLAGHGESGTAGRNAWTMPSFGDDVAAVVDHLDLRDLVLAGHSMGGDVIIEAARRLPGRVRGLIWLDTYPRLAEPGDPGQAAADLTAFLAPFRADFAGATRAFVRRLFPVDADEDLVAWVAADMAAAPPEIAVDALRHAFANEPAAIAGLRDLGLPAVAINPAEPPSDRASLARHGVTLSPVPGVGHFLMLEDPAAVSRAIGEAIASFPGPPAAP
jgi:pimeloyl-ACP methyl ester carboxylesterase